MTIKLFKYRGLWLWTTIAGQTHRGEVGDFSCSLAKRAELVTGNFAGRRRRG
jgi:hypothetical protein